MTFANLSPLQQKVAVERARVRIREIRSASLLQLALTNEEMQRRSKLLALRKSIPTAFLPFFAPARYKGAHGGRGSAKSWTFAAMLIDRCETHKGTRAVCVREIQKSLEQSVKRLLTDLISLHALDDHFRILDDHIETPGDGIIIFQGMQNHTADSIKSLEGYDIAWVEEAQSLSVRSLDLLRPTIRKDNSELWFTWNPRKPTDPVDDLLRGNAPRKEGVTWTPPPSSTIKHVTYLDNPYLPDVVTRELEWDQRIDYDKYAHIWLGEYERHSEARVFKNFHVEEFDTPSNAFFSLGGDWGYSVDPAVCVRMFLDNDALPRKRLYIDHEAYEVGCELDNLPALFDKVPQSRQWHLTADSARPETISHMRRHGFPLIKGAIKGANSVKEGVIFLQGFDIVIHPRCTHTVDEFTHYSYKRDPLTDKVTPILQDKKNHVIDSVRYGLEDIMLGNVELVQVRASGW